ncbi:MAG: hypothetical protein AB8G95_22265 [Anaerolineae bacterium]
MDEQIFVVIILGLIASIFLWAYGIWQELNWSNFLRENYLLPLFLSICGTYAGYLNGEAFGPSLLLGLIVAALTSLLFGLRFYSEFGLYKVIPSLNLHQFFSGPTNSQP